MKSVCLITVSRADYGLLRWVGKEIEASKTLRLQLVTAGTHFSEAFGQTFQEIQQDGFAVDYSIRIEPETTTPRHILQALGKALPRFSEAFDELQPEIIVLLGDRSETLLAAYAATIYGIPIAHIHGGEITAGAIDDAFRHAITKMAHIHFVSHEDYARRVIQLGEQPNSVHVTGALGEESVRRMDLLPQGALEHELGLSLSGDNLLITLHPETLHPERTKNLIEETLGALDQLEETNLVFTAANQDEGGDQINKAFRAFSSSHQRASFFESLGTYRYLSLMAHCRAVIGNSSSGILEAPVLGIPTINIGARQDGRIRKPSVVDVSANREILLGAIRRVISIGSSERKLSSNSKSTAQFPSKMITEIIDSTDPDSLRSKFFRDLPRFQS